MFMKYSVLVIEDTSELWRSMSRAVKAADLPFDIVFAANYSEAIDRIRSHAPDVVICDYYLPESRNGLEIWKYCKGRCPSALFLLVSGMSADQYLRHVTGFQNYPAFLSKPFTIAELTEAVEQLVRSGNREHQAA